MCSSVLSMWVVEESGYLWESQHGLCSKFQVSEGSIVRPYAKKPWEKTNKKVFLVPTKAMWPCLAPGAVRKIGYYCVADKVICWPVGCGVWEWLDREILLLGLRGPVPVHTMVGAPFTLDKPVHTKVSSACDAVHLSSFWLLSVVRFKTIKTFRLPGPLVHLHLDVACLRSPKVYVFLYIRKCLVFWQIASVLSCVCYKGKMYFF